MFTLGPLFDGVDLSACGPPFPGVPSCEKSSLLALDATTHVVYCGILLCGITIGMDEQRTKYKKVRKIEVSKNVTFTRIFRVRSNFTRI
jgi:hypothetical protein